MGNSQTQGEGELKRPVWASDLPSQTSSTKGVPIVHIMTLERLNFRMAGYVYPCDSHVFLTQGFFNRFKDYDVFGIGFDDDVWQLDVGDVILSTGPYAFVLLAPTASRRPLRFIGLMTRYSIGK